MLPIEIGESDITSASELEQFLERVNKDSKGTRYIQADSVKEVNDGDVKLVVEGNSFVSETVVWARLEYYEQSESKRQRYVRILKRYVRLPSRKSSSNYSQVGRFYYCDVGNNLRVWFTEEQFREIFGD